MPEQEEIVFHKPSVLLDEIKNAPKITDPERLKRNAEARERLKKLAEQNERKRSGL